MNVINGSAICRRVSSIEWALMVSIAIISATGLPYFTLMQSLNAMNAINKSGDVCPPLIFFFYMYAMIERVIQMKASASRLPIPTSGDDGIEMHFS